MNAIRLASDDGFSAGSKDRAELKTLHSLLLREGYVIARHPSCLPSHLYNRLILERSGARETAHLLSSAQRAIADRPWLRLARSSPPRQTRDALLRVFAHGGAVHALAWSPDGEMLASAGDDGLVRFWFAETATPGPTIDVSAPVHAIAWSPDGSLVATVDVGLRKPEQPVAGCQHSHAVRIWDPHSGACHATVDTRSLQCPVVTWAPDSSALVFTEEFKFGRFKFRRWNRDDGCVSDGAAFEADEVVGLLWPPGSSLTFLWSVSVESRYRHLGDQRVSRSMWLFNGMNDKAGVVRRAHTGNLYALGWAGDRLVLASFGSGGVLSVLPGAKGRDWTTVGRMSRAIRALAWSPDGGTLASGGQGVLLWDIESRTNVADFSGHAGLACCLAWAPHAAVLASGGGDGRVCLWDTTVRGAAAVEDEETAESITVAAWPATNTCVASGHFNGAVSLWDPVDGHLIGVCRDRVSEEDEGGQPPLRGHSDCVRAVAFSPDGKLLASGGDDHRVAVWDVAKREVTAVLRGHGDYVYSLAWSRDGTLLASGAGDGTVRLWDRRAGGMADKARLVRISRRGDYLWILGLAWSPYGQVLALVDGYGCIRVLEPGNPPRVGSLARCDAHNLSAFAWSPDGARFAYSGGDRAENPTEADFVIGIWDIFAKCQARVLAGHTRKVTSLAWMPDSRHLASGSMDQTVRLWDIANGRCLAVAHCLSHVLSVRARPEDGSLLVVDDGVVTRNRPVAYVYEAANLQ